MRTSVLLLIALACRAQLIAQAGVLDTDFSTDGLFAWDLSATDDQITAVTVQPDGKVVGAGFLGDGNFATILVERLLTDGTPDPGFGTGGVVYTNAVDGMHYAYAIGVQSTGNIVLAGLSYDINFDGNVVLLRYLPDGTPDATFGVNGIISTDLGGGPGFQSANAMRIMADDRIVIVGEESANGVACARFSADGAPDASFGNNGVALTGAPFSTGLCLDLYADGSVIAGGYQVVGTSDWILARFDAAGILDPGFGNGGIVSLSIGNGDTEFLRGVSIMADGRIAACGSQSFLGLDDEPIIALFADDGTLDPGFGNGGIQVLPFLAPLYGQARAIATPEGKVLVAGYRAQPSPATSNDFFLYRLLDDGTFDPAFASAGEVYTDITGSFDRGLAMALAPDGDIVLAGFGYISERSTAFARYNNDLSTAVPSTAAAINTLNVFPMPAEDHVFVEFSTQVPGHVYLRLTGSDGRTVLRVDQGMTPAGRQHFRMGIPQYLPTGMYVIEAISEEGVVRAPVLIAGTMR
ncbi:MAG: delta-60 repeat domain-containing protein [Flavobacteriales bacterium]